MDQSSQNNHRDFDVIIIGSGVGGATFADYLTRDNNNIKVAIIESGAFRDRSYFNQREIDMTELYFNRGAVLSTNMEIGVAAANTVGGSSSVYTGVSFRPPESVLEVWRNEFGLDFLSPDFVNNSLDEIEKELSIHELPESWDNQNNLLFKKGAEALGMDLKRLKINTKGCQQQGFCNLGCTSGAKQGALEVQLPNVLDRGVELIYNAKVDKIGENTVYCSISKAPQGTKASSYKEGEYRFTADYIVVAAGVLNTPAILLRSTNELSITKGNIGNYLTLHPAMNLNAVYSEEISNYKGFPKTVYSDHYSKSDHFYLETSFYYPGLTAKNIPGFGSLHSEFMKEYSKMMSILILIHDKAEKHNRISIDKKGNPQVNYKLNPDAKESLVKAIQVSTKLFFAAGCTKALIPGSNKKPLLKEDMPLIEKYITAKDLNFSYSPMSSAHPQGGARMGKDPSVSVCDTKGKVYGTESVYVCDAALFPTSVQVNPYETIMLLAKHIAENLRNEIAQS